LSQKSVSETLKGLGLSERDSEVFIFLAKKGPVTAREMFRGMRINKAQLYLSLKHLQSKGIAESTLEVPARFTATPFEQVLDLFIKAKQDEMKKAEENKEVVLSQWRSLAVGDIPIVTDKFMVIEGESYIRSRFEQMAKNARKHILITANDTDIVQAEKNDTINILITLKIPFKILTNVSSKNLATIEKTIRRIGSSAQKSQARHISLQEGFFPRFIIRDDDELMFFISTREETTLNQVRDTGLWTNNRALIDAFKTFFDQLWQQATRIEKRVNELKTGKIIPTTLFLRDAEEAYQKFLSLLNSAQNEIILVTSAQGLVSTLSLNHTLDGWNKRLVSARVMAPITKENEAVKNAFSKYCQIRNIQVNHLGEVIVDGKDLLQFKAASFVDEPFFPSAFANSFYTNDVEYIQGRRELLNALWNNSPEVIKKIERAFILNEEKFSESFMIIPTGLAITQLSDGTIIDTNNSFLEMLEYEREEAVGKKTSELSAYANSAIRQKLVEAAKEKKSIRNEEITLKSKTGKNVTLMTSADVINMDGKDYLLTVATDVTERKNAERILEKKQQELNLILNSSPSIIFYKDKEGRFIQANTAFAAALKVPKEALLGKTVFDIYPKKIAQAMTNDDCEVFESKHPKLGIIEPYESPTGLRWIRTDKIPTLDENGSVTGLIGFSEDITEQMQAELEQKQRYSLLESISENVDAGVAIIDRNYRVVWANSILRKVGACQDELCYQCVARADAVCPDCGVEKIFEEKVPLDIHEYKTVNHKGEIRWVELRVTPLKDLNGNVISALELAIPITERKKAEEALQASESKFRAVFEGATNGIVGFDPHTLKFVFANSSFCELTGYSLQELLKMTIPDIHPKECLPYVTEQIKKHLSKKLKFADEIQVLRKDKSNVYCVVNGGRLVLDKQEYFIAFFLDVSERKKLEERELENAKQLQNAERLAALGATAGMVGHDIRNPLQAISGDVYLAQSDLAEIPEGEQKESIKESLNNIEKNVEYINKIVQDLQDYARTLKPVVEEIELGELFKQVLFKNGVPKNVDASCMLDKESTRIRSDPEFLKRILNNLVSNAVQAMPNGGKLELQASEKEGDIVITVQDTGAGIPDEIKSKLFTPLFTTKAKVQGLGLAVIKRMTEALGGTVSFESELKKGTKFIIRLPAKTN